MDNLNVILGPIITEKAMNDASKGKYTFKVAVNAGKHDIKKAVESAYKVNVLKISTVIVKGRSSKTGIRRVERVQSSFKKAIVKVKEGQKIGMFDSGSSTK